MPKQYYDDNGNPIQTAKPRAKVYYDEDGEPIGGPAPSRADMVLADNESLSPLLRGGMAIVRGIKAHPVGAAAAAGGAIGTLATGGALPAILAGGGILGAGLGAAGGAGAAIAARQLATGTPEAADDTARTMATEGAVSAAGEGIGGLVAKGLAKAAPWLYKAVLRPSIPLQREFGDITATGLKEGIRVGEKGLAETGKRLTESAATARRMETAADAAGAAPIPAHDVAAELQPVLDRARLQAAANLPDLRPALRDRAVGLIQKNPAGFSVTRAGDVKRELQDVLNKVYRAEDRGGVVTDLMTDATKAQAAGLRKGIEARVPEIAPVNARSHDLIGLLRALEDSSRRNLPGVGTLRTLAGAFMPGITSGVAIGADRASRAPLAGMSRTALQALLEALQGNSENGVDSPR